MEINNIYVKINFILCIFFILNMFYFKSIRAQSDEKESDQKEAYINKAQIHINKEENIPLYEEHFNNGNKKLKQKKYSEAIYEFEKALEYNNKNLETYFNLAIAYMINNNYEKTLLLYFEILGLSPHNTDVFLKIAETYLHINDFENSEKYYSHVLSVSPLNKEAQEGLSELKKQKELYENSAENHYNKGRYLFEKGEIEESIEAFKKSIEINDNFFPSYIELGKIYSYNNKFDQALEIYRSVIRYDDNYVPAYLGISRIFFQKKDYPKAMEVLEKLNPDERDESVSMQLDIIKRKMNNVLQGVLIGDILYKNGYFDDAYEKYFTAEQDFPGYIPVYIKIADVYLEKNNIEKAEEYYKKAQAINKAYIPALLGQAKIYEMRKNNEMAYKYYRQIQKIDPENKKAFNFIKLQERDTDISVRMEEISKSLNLTREELAVLLVEKFELERRITDRIKGVIIIDIDDHWAYDYIKKIVETGIMDLFPNRMFLPTKSVTKGEFALCLKNIRAKLSYEKIIDKDFSKLISVSPYKDVPPLHERFNAVISSSLDGVLTGFNDNTFKADDLISGEEAIEAINRLNNKVNVQPLAVSIQPE
ncbi:MAG: tetratricopeptide repeat protein [Candidatus Firestonebacteria bacterium]|nr:tetratricopeptide repeat protein [Candidatus Firestonebacteria bacterium]